MWLQQPETDMTVMTAATMTIVMATALLPLASSKF
jgi:hypothetical protein